MIGQLIALNGTSSAGKSTLATAIQSQLVARGQCWVIIGIDDFLGKLPYDWVGYFDEGAHADQGVRFDRVGGDIVLRTGPVGRSLLTGYRRATAAVVRSGVNVILDDVVVDDEAWAEWESELGALRPFWVRVDCPVDICEQRERERRDRLPGLARSQTSVVHRLARYDFIVDTATAAPGELARSVIEAHDSRG